MLGSQKIIRPFFLRKKGLFFLVFCILRSLQYPIYAHWLVIWKKQRIVRAIMLLACFLYILCFGLGH
ncbi:MAG TPA: hypothetical protein DD405_05260, partial [Desulfobacteraceae bacterium]|nr:hypothetical protein [Desulfobacteraceae bacterium]